MTPWRRARGADNLAPSTVKRRCERYLLSTRLTARIREREEEVKIQAQALDISEIGLGAVSAEGWGVGTYAELEISLPLETTRLEVHAVVRHRAGLRCGLEFVNVSPEQQKMLQHVCKSLAVGRPESFY